MNNDHLSHNVVLIIIRTLAAVTEIIPVLVLYYNISMCSTFICRL